MAQSKTLNVCHAMEFFSCLMTLYEYMVLVDVRVSRFSAPKWKTLYLSPVYNPETCCNPNTRELRK